MTSGVPPSAQQFVSRQRPPPQPQQYSFSNSPPKVESFPRGYPRLSAFMDSDSDFAMFRRFGRLHTRILLHKQDELAELESRLDEMDKTESVPYFHSARRHDTNPERKSIIEEAEKKLKEYNELLASHFQHLERPGPKESDLESMTHWMLGNKPLVVEESTFMDDWEDLRRPKAHADHGHLEVLLESWAAAFNGRGIFKMLTRTAAMSKSDDPHVVLFKASSVVAMSRFLATAFAVLSLVVPVVVLYIIESTPQRLGIITVFTAIFSSLLCWLTQSRNYEIFSATAAYCAVMVVFVGSIPVT